jgi:hypothetical protein
VVYKMSDTIAVEVRREAEEGRSGMLAMRAAWNREKL